LEKRGSIEFEDLQIGMFFGGKLPPPNWIWTYSIVTKTSAKRVWFLIVEIWPKLKVTKYGITNSRNYGDTDSISFYYPSDLGPLTGNSKNRKMIIKSLFDYELEKL
jgi:hypothetical protein